MIIIDEHADDKLIQALKSLSHPEGNYCIRLHPVNGDAGQTRQHITLMAHKHLSGANLYFCDDGEGFIVAQTTAKECRKTMLDIATALGIQSADHVGELHDLVLQTGALVMLLEKRIESRRNTEETLMRQQAQEQAAAQTALKRQGILEQDTHRTAHEIAALRSARDEPILMIIEDDPFSRRLVDNVLQKQFKLTSLESADGALSIYADIAPDLLFLDIKLPDVTGHELLEKIIALDPDSYVVMLSGNADRENIMQAMSRGAKGFVAKPFSRDKLFQYIERCPTISKEHVQ